MFCGNCGRKIPDNAAFCPGCGTAISKRKANIEETGEGGLNDAVCPGNNEKKLYEGRGISKQLRILLTSICVVMMVCGIFLIWCSQAKSSTIKMTSGYFDNNGTFHSLDFGRGYIGGNNILTQEGQNAAIMLGFAAIILGMLLVYLLSKLKQCSISLYETYMDGTTLKILGGKYHISYDEILSVYSTGIYIVIMTEEKGYSVITPDKKAAQAYLKNVCSGY